MEAAELVCLPARPASDSRAAGPAGKITRWDGNRVVTADGRLTDWASPGAGIIGARDAAPVTRSRQPAGGRSGRAGRCPQVVVYLATALACLEGTLIGKHLNYRRTVG
jgi:hypothetical protein